MIGLGEAGQRQPEEAKQLPGLMQLIELNRASQEMLSALKAADAGSAAALPPDEEPG